MYVFGRKILPYKTDPPTFPPCLSPSPSQSHPLSSCKFVCTCAYQTGTYRSQHRASNRLLTEVTYRHRRNKLWYGGMNRVPRHPFVICLQISLKNPVFPLYKHHRCFFMPFIIVHVLLCSSTHHVTGDHFHGPYVR